MPSTQATYAKGNAEKREAVTVILYESKDAAVAYANSSIRQGAVGRFRDMVDGPMEVTEYEVCFLTML